jgi:hypothetical protein
MGGDATISELLLDMRKPSSIDLACADVIHRALGRVMLDLGINSDDAEEIHQQMEEREIEVVEQDWGLENAELSGIYVYKKMEPMAFLSTPFLDRQSGKVSLKLVRFYKSERVDGIEGGRLV